MAFKTQLAILQSVLTFHASCKLVPDPDILNHEPRDAEYWGRGVEGLPPFSVPEFHYEDLSRESFDRMVSEGRVFVVRRSSSWESHPMSSWNCSFFSSSSTFRDVEVRRAYSKDGRTHWDTLRNRAAVEHGLPSREDAPYYLGIKDAGGDQRELQQDPFYSRTWTAELLALIQSKTIVPKFMDPANRKEMRLSPELWFASGTARAQAHVDAHKESTMSLQLSGRKIWRLAPVAPRAAPHVLNLYSDGQIYSRPEKWRIFKDVLLDQGDAIFFPPAFIHETESMEGTCAASITWQFNVPAASVFWRTFLPRLRRTPDCMEIWPHLRSLSLKSEEMNNEGRIDRDMIRFLDMDGDGNVSKEERKSIARLWRKLERQVNEEIPSELLAQGFGIDRMIQDTSRMPRHLATVAEKWEAKAWQLDTELQASRERSLHKSDEL